MTLLLCTMAVVIKPLNTPSRGYLLNLVMKLIILCICARGLMANSIVCKPCKKRPNHSITCPTNLFVLFLVKINIPVPTPIAGKAIFVNLKAISCAVIVVPIFAPIITPMA